MPNAAGPVPTYGRRREDRARRAPWFSHHRRLRLGPRLDPRSVSALGRLGPLVTFLRWASLAVGLALLPTVQHATESRYVIAAAVVTANTIFRTVRPLRLQPATWRAELTVLADLSITVVAISITADWASPFILTPLPTVIVAAYAWGYREGLLTAALTGVTIEMVDLLSGVSGDTLRTGVLATVVVLLAALIGGFTRQLWLEAERRQQETLDQVTRMSIANDLLHALHDVVQTLPASLDLSDVVTSARRRFRDLFESTTSVVLVPDESANVWRVELAEGTRLPDTLTRSELPHALQRALATEDVVRITDVTPGDGTACDPSTQSLLATALRAQDRVVGLVSIEHRDPGEYTAQDASLIGGLAGSLALAVDNARWFSRLRTLGAEAERARIARDLHDRIAQSLAFVGFELDRLSTAHDDRELRELHQVVRGVVSELRETLYQLRAGVSEDENLATVARPYLDRWEQRTGIEAQFTVRTAGRRLPLQIEQELWRILQESLTNVERHADATHTWINWEINDASARLVVRDDGRGIRPDRESRERYGIVGIRERADAIGAEVSIESEPGAGTKVLVELGVKE